MIVRWMMSSFSKKILVAEITLASGNFGSVPDQNTKILRDLRMELNIVKGGDPSKNSCKLRVYGMLEDDMNSLVNRNTFNPLAVRRSFLRILAGDESRLDQIFKGEISSAFASYQASQLCFQIEALEGYYPSLAPSQPKSFKGSIPARNILQILAAEMGYSFEPNNITGSLINPYLCGSAFAQAQEVARAANLEFGIDNGVLFAANRNEPRTGNAVLISKDTGLKEYPTFDKQGIKLECLFNPAFKLGGLIEVRSVIKAANRAWRIHGMNHVLECEKPGGAWLTRINAAPLNAPVSQGADLADLPDEVE